MTLEEFATLAGVAVFTCDPEWGGRFAYRTADTANCAICGYRTEKAAIKGWLRDTFGEATGKAVSSLLTRAKA